MMLVPKCSSSLEIPLADKIKFLGLPWERPDVYAQHNPALHVGNWHTPQLVIHGELDSRVPYSEALSTFNALQVRNVPSKLVIFPDEGHDIKGPENLVFFYDEVITWIDKWTEA